VQIKGKSHGSCAIIGLTKNQNRTGTTMGRKQLIVQRHCKSSHFTWSERLMLQYYYCGSNGYTKERSPTVLAAIFQKHPKTISRELKRGMVEHTLGAIPFFRIEYNADHAHFDATEKMRAKGPPAKSAKHWDLVNRISELIKKKHYSPYAVIETLKAEGSFAEGMTICEKTLYNWIEAGDIPDVTIKDLPRKGKMKSKRGSGKPRRHSRINCATRSIENRPKDVLKRLEAGHWEADTLYSTKRSSKEALLTLIERKSRTQLILKLADRKAHSVTEALDKLERQLGSSLFSTIFKSITFDNGSEFSDVIGLESSVFTKTKRTELYFAHPYCSSERATNENHNGIIRRFLPKGTDFALVKNKRVKEIQQWMNNYPRKILSGFTPIQIFKKEFGLTERLIKLMEAA
jgi:IS30 family transposase